MIVIIDAGMGNVGSVKNALAFLEADALISNKREDIERGSHLILPGVGSFSDGMKRLEQQGLIPILENAVIKNKKPFLGICLGMQLLAEGGEEGGLSRGLGWITGKVRRFQVDEKKFRIPHMGWDDVAISGKATLFQNVDPKIFYFVHSYFLTSDEENIVSARCAYGENFIAAVEKGNIFGTQFHPEKSQGGGLTLLKNFINYKI